MTNWLRKIPRPDRETVLGLLGYWAIYLAFAIVMGLGSGQIWVFFVVGFGVPAFLVAAFAFAFVNVAIFLLGVIAAGRVASWAYHRFLWDRFRFHFGAWARSKGIQKIEDRRRTAWGLLADAFSGFALGVGFSGVIFIPFLGGPVFSFQLLTEAPPWLTPVAWIMLTLGVSGAALCVSLRLASDPLWELTREKVAELPPPVDPEYF